ncbi:MAG: hypothetical protein LBF38_12090 [Deltaproteobacteria bacterium]|jgi:hypothetical protein|nr:hypothetical protein [Deltaproteobacteria bacterium]
MKNHDLRKSVKLTMPNFKPAYYQCHRTDSWEYFTRKVKADLDQFLSLRPSAKRAKPQKSPSFENLPSHDTYETSFLESLKNGLSPEALSLARQDNEEAPKDNPKAQPSGTERL